VKIHRFLNTTSRPNAAIFLSGSGSNAEKLLEYNSKAWNPAVLVTDAPSKSRAKELSEKYSLPLAALDISAFYKERGEEKVTLMTERGRTIREDWTNELRKLIKPYNVDFGILAGFVPLTNITSDFPCLNVHPGDLTYEKDGKRVLVGLHTIPVERAIMEQLTFLRSSVILAQPYTGAGGEMDSGPVLGISEPVKIDFSGHTLGELSDIYAERPPKRPSGGYKDTLENLASANQEKLKIHGDWIIFPPVVEDFASGNFAMDEGSNLLYNVSGNWKQIKTVVYSNTSRTPVYI